MESPEYMRPEFEKSNELYNGREAAVLLIKTPFSRRAKLLDATCALQFAPSGRGAQIDENNGNHNSNVFT
uniref:Uncharacterized protein n=1 Tax=Ascaris lumbricoides TaxID=6252 RepID=A0A0M3IHP9_ASCLU